jgi:hypothetical protein
MIDQKETGRSVVPGARTLVVHRMNGGLEGAYAFIRLQHASSDYATASAGERWRARMTRAHVPAPYAATLMLRTAWYAHGLSWTRPDLSPQTASKLADCDG